MHALALPLSDSSATYAARNRRIPKGMDALAHRWLGSIRNSRRIDVRFLTREADRAVEIAATLEKLSSENLAGQMRVLREEIHAERLKAGLPVGDARTFALLAETMRRAVGLRAYPEQILAASYLVRGVLVEMATGEGKTLSVGLAAAALAAKGFPCHVITANDYLVQRDAGWLEDFYLRCGLETGTVTADFKPPARREAYRKPVTYVTSKEVVADFLRDALSLGKYVHPRRRMVRRMARPREDPLARTVLRGLHVAIIDEADHVLVDEAVTPLIISRPVGDFPLGEACLKAHMIAGTFAFGVHYETIPRFRDVELTETGRTVLAAALETLPPLWRNPARAEEIVRQALVAREFYRPGEQYVLTPEGKIAIIDESTGRLTPDRTWQQGLHQAIEVKEKIPLSRPNETLARMSFQRFFRSYRHLAGCTGTARESRGEMWQIYRLPVRRVPTHRPCLRRRLPTRIFHSLEAKRDAIVATVEESNRRRQPVLVGTSSVAESEVLATRFAARGLSCEVLNAARHSREASIVMEAGHRGAITIATNMAGRGTDIRLAPGVEALGGLLVILTERHDSRRIDRQLEGRSGRQGEPGEYREFASLEDALAQRYLSSLRRHFLGWLLRIGLPGSVRLADLALRKAQRRASGQSLRSRRAVLRHDEWLNESLAFAGRGDETG